MQTSRTIHIDLAPQQLELRENGARLVSYPISSSAFGLGSEPGSNKTPLGRFEISEKIGDGAPLGMIFRSRVPAGEFGLEEQPDDHVQTRILWLHGLEPHNANTHERYIYIHGTNHEREIGLPVSHGCIRMRNEDVILLFDAVEIGTEVFIQP